MTNPPSSFPSVSLPHGFTTKELATSEDKKHDHAKLLSGPVGWANQSFVGLYDMNGALAAIIIASHSKKVVFSIVSKHYDPLPEEALAAVETFLLALDYRIEGVTKRPLKKRIMGADGRFHDLNALPDELHVKGDMIFYAFDGTIRLPRRKLRVDGQLYLRDLDIETFPSEFLHVEGDADFWGTRINDIPEGTFIGGDFRPAKETKHLPRGFKVGHDLNICLSQVRSIPSGTRCRQLLMETEQIRHLPLSFGIRTMILLAPTKARGWLQVNALRYRSRRLLGLPRK